MDPGIEDSLLAGMHDRAKVFSKIGLFRQIRGEVVDDWILSVG